MNALPFIFVALLWSIPFGFLHADDGIHQSNNPADYKFFGEVEEGISLGVYMVPLPSADIPANPYAFQVILKNASTRTVYFSESGLHAGLKLKIVDERGEKYDIREKASGKRLTIAIAPGRNIFPLAFLSDLELKALGHHSLIAVAEVYDQAPAKGTSPKTITVRSAPFQIYPHGGAETPLPADPVLAQLKIVETSRRAAFENATNPEARSEAAGRLAYFYLDGLEDGGKAAALLPEITDPVDHFDTQLMIITRNPRLTGQQKVDALEALAPDCPEKRSLMLKGVISQYKYLAQHPDESN